MTKRSRADALNDLFPPDAPGLVLTGEGTILRRQSPDEVALVSDLARYMRMSDSMGEAHRPLAIVTELGERLEQAQGRLTSFQARVLVALYVGSWPHPDSVEPVLDWSLLATDDAERLRAARVIEQPGVAELFVALLAAPVQVPGEGATAH